MQYSFLILTSGDDDEEGGRFFGNFTLYSVGVQESTHPRPLVDNL